MDSGHSVICIPRINFTAKDNIDLIDWQNTQISEPPILANTEVRVKLESHQIMLSFNTKE